MTIREVSFVYPQLTTIAQSADLSPARALFITGLLAKLTPVIAALATKQEQLIVAHGERFGELQRFRLRTTQQNDTFKAEMRLHKNQDVPVVLTRDETTLFEMLYYQAVINGYEDFPEI